MSCSLSYLTLTSRGRSQTRSIDLSAETGRYSHVLGELWRLVVDVSHPYPYRGRARARDVALVDGHHDELVQMVGPLVVQRTRRKDGPVWGDGEVWTQGVVRQLRVLL